MKKFNFHVKPIGLLDMLHFKKMVPRRRAILQAGSLDPITAVYGVNRLAQSLHPKRQKAVISEIIPRKDANTYVLKADKLAYFRAGQYVSVNLQIGDTITTRPYTLAASPALALDGQYQITVKKAPDGFVSEYILDHWKVGTEVTLSGPEGPFSYEPIRDEAEIVGLAGGSGITPFMAMANAILEKPSGEGVLLRIDDISLQSHALATAIHVGERSEALVRGLFPNGGIRTVVLEPTPEGKEDAQKLVTSQLRVFAIINVARMLQPPLEAKSRDISDESLREHIFKLDYK